MSPHINNMNSMYDNCKRICLSDSTLIYSDHAAQRMAPAQKLLLAGYISDLGIDVIQAGFAAGSQEDFDTIGLISRNVHGIKISAWATSDKNSIERACDALKSAYNPRIHIFLEKPQYHAHSDHRQSVEELVDRIHESVSYAKSLCNDIEFTPGDPTRNGNGYLYRVVKTAIQSGANVVNIADSPAQFARLEFSDIVKRTVRILPEGYDAMIGVQCRDNHNHALNNTLEGIDAGARQVDCTIKSILGYTGNCSLEDLAWKMCRTDYHAKYSIAIDDAKLQDIMQLQAGPSLYRTVAKEKNIPTARIIAKIARRKEL